MCGVIFFKVVTLEVYFFTIRSTDLVVIRMFFIEINNASLDPKGFRKNTREIDMEILEVCKEYQAPVVLGSDAHMDIDVGNHQRALDLLEEVHFPEELVVNRSVEELKKYANKYKNS